MSTMTGRCLKLLEKCKNMKQLRQAHANSITCGLQHNTFALSRLLAFCAHPLHGNLSHALKIFQHIEKPTNCICNTVMKACSIRNDHVRIIHLYKHMLGNAMQPDNYTLPYALKACVNMKWSLSGELIHGQCLKFGFLIDIFVGNTLILMYSTSGKMEGAQKVFDEIPYNCVVSWTLLISGYAKQGHVETARLVFDDAPIKDRGIWASIISGYVQNNCFKECLQMFRIMQTSCVSPDEAIFISLLCACGNLGALEIGLWVHRYLVRRTELKMNVRLGTALIDMYAKCGRLDLAERLFAEMPESDTICWNVMISGLAMNGDGVQALGLFAEMKRAKVQPDDITFISIFAACSHSGMEYEALKLFNTMRDDFNIEPKSEHYGCIIDCLCRAGKTEEAMNVIQKMPSSCSPSEEAIAWRALLNTCNSHGQIDLAEIAAEKLVQLEKSESGVYVLLSNLYSSAGDYDNVKRVRKMMKGEGIEKAPGCSSVELNGVVHEFIAGEKTNFRMEDIHTVLEVLNKQLD